MDNNEVNPVNLVDQEGIQQTGRGFIRAIGSSIKAFFIFTLKMNLNFLAVYLLLYIPHIIPFKAVGWEPLYYTLDFELITTSFLFFFEILFSEGFLLLTIILSLFPFRLIANIICSPPFLFTYIPLLVASFTLSPFVEEPEGVFYTLFISGFFCLLIFTLRTRISFLSNSVNFNEDREKGLVSIILGTNNLYSPEQINRKRGQ